MKTFEEFLLDLAEPAVLDASAPGRYKVLLEDYAVYNDFFTVCLENVYTHEKLYYLVEIVRSPYPLDSPCGHVIMIYRKYQSAHIAYIALTDLE